MAAGKGNHRDLGYKAAGDLDRRSGVEIKLRELIRCFSLGEFTPLAQPASPEAEDTLLVPVARSILAWVAASIRGRVDDSDASWPSFVELGSATRSEPAAQGARVVAVSRQLSRPLLWPNAARPHCRRDRSLPLAPVRSALDRFPVPPGDKGSNTPGSCWLWSRTPR
jgi:hypothetical protein